VTPEQLAQVEQIVNDVIARDLPVHFEEMTVPEAKAKGAIGLFEDRYGEKVKVYVIGDFPPKSAVVPTSAIRPSSATSRSRRKKPVPPGVRRIKAVLEPI